MSSPGGPTPETSARLQDVPPPGRTAVGTDTADRGFWHGRSGLVLAGLMVAFSLYLIYGIVTMEVPEGTDFPGPAFFPTILVVVGLVLAALLVLHYLRSPEVPEAPESPDGRTWRTHTDWRSVAWCVAGFFLFALTLEWLGWILAAALLFWFVARGMGSRRPVFDITLALLMSSAVYLAFAEGLQLNLPAGFLGGI
ncbi:tripartite tricarboxylate transporter TctB family protein [Ornithinimicrobium cerasi]|uniref:Putative tricarboxylic transport membrane protein n=1 Tax=Ornithinimicrobium cerasi TaxID=2248773 RepID=A0A285VB25_9MICO|nr:tripartite tricarboxylate transporter TctB family protein [Ornithinimicrobium cerasi]SOC51332.1 putative tricarboxylic transport membrane protein [Ornithinimicrobium cerasi]